MDEADFLIRLNAIVYDEEKKQLLGLLQLKGKNFLMCSATYSPLEKKILKWCVKIPSDQIFEYLNTNTIVQKRVKNVDPVTLIKKLVWQNKDEVKHRLVQFVEMHRASPIIVFMEKKDSELTKLLQEEAKRNQLPFELLLNAKEVKGYLEIAAKKQTGIYIIGKEFGRGVDFKLGQNAIVLILFNGDLKFTKADVTQMAGRGNRQQVTPNATIALPNLARKNDIDAILNQNS